ncbi:hypothetical protein PSH51_20035, partial [Pseudoalteromonas sp. CST4]|uniref:hypothetical protein n=1 Tax=Pseudoalteromonas sp. CST4 TaxID=3025329 RepID=UPI0023585BDC
GNINGTSDGLMFIGGTGSGGDFRGLLDEVKIYSEALSAAQIFQNFAYGSDGLSDSVTIAPQETSVGQTWQCQVTPNDGYQDGTPGLSNLLSVVAGNTRPHIDWYSPVLSELDMYVGESIDFKAASSDPNDDSLTYEWTVDTVPQGGATESTWTYAPLSASVHTVGVT